MSTTAHDQRRELAAVVLFTLASVIVSLDMSIAQPLSVNLTNALKFKTTDLNLVFGAHAAGAAMAGVAGAFFLDRVGRGFGFAFASLGVTIGALLTASATGLGSLVVGRLVSGWFDCIMSAIAGAIVLDEVPFARRGRTLGIASSVAGLASMLLIPCALYVTRLWSVRLPFVALACLSLVAMLCSTVYRATLSTRPSATSSLPRLRRAPLTIMVSYAIFAIEAIAGGLFAPFVVPFVLKNLGYPRSRLELMFLGIGVAAAIAATLAGWLTDRIGGAWMMSIGGIGCIFPAVLLVVLTPSMTMIPILVGAFVIANLVRGSGLNVLSTRAAREHERARFTAVVHTLFHVGTVVGIAIGSQLVTETPSGGLGGAPRLLAVAAVLVVGVVPLGWFLQRRLAAESAVEGTA